MSLNTIFKRLLFVPHFIQFGEENPRPSDWAHVVGRGVENVSGSENRNPDGKNDNEPKPEGKYDARGYRRLNSITLGEVNAAFKFYEKQLIPSRQNLFIAANHFYMLDLAQTQKNIPSAIFGRVNACHPSDGHIQNIREMELSFPQPAGKPDTVNLHAMNFSFHSNAQGYRFRVKFLASEEDQADFARHDDLFSSDGLILDFDSGYLDLLELDESDGDSLPWFHVIGSRWFASIPPSMQEEVRASLERLSARDTLLVNYHPDHLPAHVKKLNDELGFQYRLTDFLLTDPKTPRQVHRIVKSAFEAVFTQASAKAAHLSNRQNRITP